MIKFLLPITAAFNGWSIWSEWSDCNEDGERSRQRKCLKTDPEPNECQGNERDIRACMPQALPGKKYPKTHEINGLIKQFIYSFLYRSSECGRQCFNIYLVAFDGCIVLFKWLFIHLYETTKRSAT